MNLTPDKLARAYVNSLQSQLEVLRTHFPDVLEAVKDKPRVAAMILERIGDLVRQMADQAEEARDRLIQWADNNKGEPA